MYQPNIWHKNKNTFPLHAILVFFQCPHQANALQTPKKFRFPHLGSNEAQVPTKLVKFDCASACATEYFVPLRNAAALGNNIFGSQCLKLQCHASISRLTALMLLCHFVKVRGVNVAMSLCHEIDGAIARDLQLMA